MDRILVTGATGRIGREVVRLLLEAQQPIRVLVRSPEAAVAHERPGIEPIVGDFDQPETLDEALEGIDKLFLLSPADPRLVDQQGQAVEAAKRAGVQYIV
jgi:uncharacterized protein YbjT (DUF2867 family)